MKHNEIIKLKLTYGGRKNGMMIIKNLSKYIPVGPLRLSIHPGIGSFMAAVTMEGRIIATGILSCSCWSSFSAKAFV